MKRESGKEPRGEFHAKSAKFKRKDRKARLTERQAWRPLRFLPALREIIRQTESQALRPLRFLPALREINLG